MSPLCQRTLGSIVIRPDGVKWRADLPSLPQITITPFARDAGHCLAADSISASGSQFPAPTACAQRRVVMLPAWSLVLRLLSAMRLLRARSPRFSGRNGPAAVPAAWQNTRPGQSACPGPTGYQTRRPPSLRGFFLRSVFQTYEDAF